MWINAIRSYRREESEITQATCRRLGCGKPKKGCLYAVHVKAVTGPIKRAPIQAWTVEAIGPLVPGDGPDGEGQNPVVEGAGMLIGLWDWGRAEEHLRSGWRSIEMQAPRKGETPLKWHLSARKVNGEEVCLDVCKNAGIEKSEIMHKAAERMGLPRNATYQVCVKGVRTGDHFRAKGVSLIHHTAARGAGSGELPAWERPNVLLGMKDAERLEGFLRTGWRNDSGLRNGMPKRRKRGGVTTSVCSRDRPTSSNTVATVEEAAEQYRADPRGATWSSRRQAYADDTTRRTEETMRPDQPETGERGSEKDRWTYVQKIRTGVEGQGIELRVMFDNNTPHTLILYTAAARAALVPVWKEKLVMSPDSGEPEESLCKYSVPLVDWQGNAHWLKARGVGYTIYAGERKVPSKAAALFLEMEGKASRAHQAAGMVDLIVGKDNQRWQPQKFCDSWQTEDNLTLMRSEFPPRYITRETMRTKHMT